MSAGQPDKVSPATATAETLEARTGARPESAAPLHPTAAKILEAAHRILEEEGFEGLSFDAIAKRSGQYKGSITYFFGDKATLTIMLADVVGHDIVAAARERLQQLPEGPDRVHEAVAVNAEVCQNSEEFRVFLDILAKAVRREDLRERFALLYREYREVNRRMLGEGSSEPMRSELDLMATLSLAIVDGLSLQLSLDPDGFDPSPYWRCWEEVVAERLWAAGGGEAHGG
jgi:AcrR family transcriptional regulator